MLLPGDYNSGNRVGGLKTSELEREQPQPGGGRMLSDGGWTEAAVFQVGAKSAADRKAMRAKVYV